MEFSITVGMTIHDYVPFQSFGKALISQSRDSEIIFRGAFGKLSAGTGTQHDYLPGKRFAFCPSEKEEIE